MLENKVFSLSYESVIQRKAVHTLENYYGTVLHNTFHLESAYSVSLILSVI